MIRHAGLISTRDQEQYGERNIQQSSEAQARLRRQTHSPESSACPILPPTPQPTTLSFHPQQNPHLHHPHRHASMALQAPHLRRPHPHERSHRPPPRLARIPRHPLLPRHRARNPRLQHRSESRPP